MKPKTMILMGLAVVCGLGASYMTSRLLAERQPDEQEKIKILVARRVLSVGERITKPEELFEIKEVTKENEPPDAIKEFEQVKGKVMKQTRNRGDHISASNLYDGGGLEIPEGHMASGVRVNLETSASGLATLPGSRVNLILTMRAQDVKQTKVIVLLENVLVLAADTRVTREGDIAAPSQVVTFAMKPKDVSRIAGASELGVIRLSLRKLHDDSRVEDREMGIDEILFGDKKKEEPKAVVKAEPTPEKPPIVTEPPKVEAPKGEQKALLIHNGTRTDQVPYREFENGDITFGETSTPAPQPRLQQQPQQPQPPVAPGKAPARDF